MRSYIVFFCFVHRCSEYTLNQGLVPPLRIKEEYIALTDSVEQYGLSWSHNF